MGNTVYAIRCVCLCILCSGGHTGFVSLFIQNKNRERSELNKPREKRAPYYGGKKNQQNNDLSDNEDLIKKKYSKEYDIFLT
jgi:hypothetical protein